MKGSFYMNPSSLLIQKSLFDKPTMVFSAVGVLFTLLAVDKSDWGTNEGLVGLHWSIMLILAGVFISLVLLAVLVTPLLSGLTDEEEMLIWLPCIAELILMFLLASSMLLEVSPYILVSLTVIHVIHYARLVVSFMAVLWSSNNRMEGVNES